MKRMKLRRLPVEHDHFDILPLSFDIDLRSANCDWYEYFPTESQNWYSDLVRLSKEGWKVGDD
jgi:hypothetical protein